MIMYQVGIESQTIWTGWASTGVNALHEASAANPHINKADLWVETLRTE